MIPERKILIIDFCNYDDYPIGGYLSFAKNLMISFGNQLSLVGITTDINDPIGKWFKKSIDSIDYDFFAFAYYSKLKTKHIIPDRLVTYLLLKYYRNQILTIDINNVFIQRQEVLEATKNYSFNNICYCFAGLENPLAISKYWYAHHLAKYFEKRFFRSLKYAKLVLASGDEAAIEEMILRSNGSVKREAIHQFPSRINTNIYKTISKKEARLKLDIPDANSIIITTGRLARLKGWKFMIDSFMLYEKVKPGSLLYFIGSGEDLYKIEAYISSNKLEDKIILAGKQDANVVALYLNAADLFIMGSFKEGWSTSLIEAIACGIPACVTNFSSAKDIILEGKNGVIIEDHDVEMFANGMLNAIKIQRPVFNENIMALSFDKLKAEILEKWNLL